MLKMSDNLQTRDGRAVVMLHNDIKNKLLPIVGIITEKDGTETADVWRADGHYDIESKDKSPMDLVIVQPVVDKPAAEIMPKKADKKAKATKRTPKAPTTQAKAEIATTATKQAKKGIVQEPPEAEVDEDDLKDLEDNTQEPLVLKTKKGDIYLVGNPSGKSARHPIVKHHGGKKV